MKKDFFAANWKQYLPEPICEAHPEYNTFYQRAWELAHDHVKDLPGMPQTPYMDEGFCDTQVWIWDTCFMTLFCKFAPEVFPGVESFRNFYDVLYHNKILPEVIPTEQEPKWTHAVPGVPFHVELHIADNPPLFSFAEYENALIHGDADYLRELLYEKGSLQRHYDWIESLCEKLQLPGVHCETFLAHEECGYTWEGGRSGMDNTPRGRVVTPADKERPNNPDMLWIDAICQQALSAHCIAKLFALLGDTESEKKWLLRFHEKKELVNRFYWDARDGFYYDIDRRDHRFYRVMTIASYWALTAEIASAEQAAAMALHASNPDELGGALPLISLARNDPDFCDSGLYWRGALWLPTAYAALKGLANYAKHKEAHEAACKILSHMWKTYEGYEPHTIWECYSPTAFEPATTTKGNAVVRPDFCGWSALGPISIYLEYVLGFHTVNAFTNTVEWARPTEFQGNVGVKNLRFGKIVTDIVANGSTCRVCSNAPYTLVIDGKPHAVSAGENTLAL